MAADNGSTRRHGAQLRDKNHQWKGGRSVASNGYVLVKVGVDHHLADVRGYAYEHRLEAEKMIGRRLKDGEQVHHRDGDKQNNAPENLEVHEDCAHHKVEHRGPNSTRRLPDEPNPMIQCACGCGVELLKFDAFDRPRMFVTGHNPPDAPAQAAVLALLTNAPVARGAIAAAAQLPVQTVADALTRLRRNGLAERVRRGFWRRSPRVG